MSIPGVGEIVGLWDLRETIDDYLGRIDFAGKRGLCAKRCRSILITELYYPEMTGAICELIPTRENEVWHTWWRFGPDFFTRYLGVLGFGDTKMSYHEHRHTLVPEHVSYVLSCGVSNLTQLSLLAIVTVLGYAERR